MKLKFCGASKMVTGSCYYIEAMGRKFLIDCGLFHGEEEEKNKERFPFNPNELDFVILTHAHIDHSGRIPLLYKRGFKGTIYCTQATGDLIKIMLRDSAHIQISETEWENKKRQQKKLDLVEPLYDFDDVELALENVHTIPYNYIFKIDSNIHINLKDAGHLLGSSIVELFVHDRKVNKKVVFTGDLGNLNIPIIKDHEYINEADYLIVESTYGNRLHKPIEESNSLYNIIVDTIQRGGNVIIPSFAVGRTQELLYILNNYIDIEKRSRLQDVDIYVDSPLATAATEIFREHMECFDEETLKKLDIDNFPLDFNNLTFTSSKEASIRLAYKKGVVIISSSGMCDAGRIKHHLKSNIEDENSSIVFVGYQASGTLGRRILDGEKRVKIFGESLNVKAKIHEFPGLSGHADMDGLIHWIKSIKDGVRGKIFLTHGDVDAIDNLSREIKQVTSADIVKPSIFEEYKL
ncbi:MBL fold metallo-hydrolase [Clostridium cylindrosporum]|uniref:Ribonuclease n=1 Tax=Clostridium cylindrosporum DSM 605 TaxID=1121307 RepID=A0A0J8G1V2_CLOCY|nr:MBL fold metallo-hydrolase [Clostridium cylindrosporum]KMT21726.1 ribonuclease [Clostridium cylindrosporum DSM 605]